MHFLSFIVIILLGQNSVFSSEVCKDPTELATSCGLALCKEVSQIPRDGEELRKLAQSAGVSVDGDKDLEGKVKKIHSEFSKLSPDLIREKILENPQRGANFSGAILSRSFKMESNPGLHVLLFRSASYTDEEAKRVQEAIRTLFSFSTFYSNFSEHFIFSPTDEKRDELRYQMDFLIKTFNFKDPSILLWVQGKTDFTKDEIQSALTEVSEAFGKFVKAGPIPTLMYEEFKSRDEELTSSLENAKNKCLLMKTLLKKAEENNPAEFLNSTLDELSSGFQKKFSKDFGQKDWKEMNKILSLCKAQFTPEHERSQGKFSLPVSKVPFNYFVPGYEEFLNYEYSCEENVKIYDHFHSKEGIKISTQTIAFKDKGTVAHEVGHCLSHYLDSDERLSSQGYMKFKSLIGCLSETKKGTLNEDFADWFSVATLPESTNLGCSITRLEKDFSYDQVPAHVHSSTLYRALHASILREEELPLSCKELMNVKDVKPVKCGF